MGMSAVDVRQATVKDLEILVPLFDGYRQFYRQASEPGRVREFLRDRFANKESVIFLALLDTSVVGFAQLYPSFSSAAMARIFILNDLFVTKEARRCGAGSALLRAAAEYCERAGAIRLVLSTERSNATAQSLYERTGWKRDSEFYVYQLALPVAQTG